MCTTTVPATGAEALDMLESAAGMQECALRFLAAEDAAALPAQAVADRLRLLERNDAIEAAVRARLLVVVRCAGRAPGRRAAEHPHLAGPLDAGHQGPGRRAPGGPGAGPRPPGAARGAGRGLSAHQVRRPAAGPVDQGHPGGVPGQGRGDPGRRGPRAGRACGRWPRSARRSGPAPPSPTPTTRTTRAWTAALSLDTTFDGAGRRPR